MGTDGNAVDAAVETPLGVDAVTVVAIDVAAVVETVAMLRVQEDMTQQVWAGTWLYGPLISKYVHFC